jgi:hypothetical protein
MLTFSIAVFNLAFILTLTLITVTGANASPPDDTQAIEYIGIKEFSDVASLSNIPKNLREKKIDSLRNEFSTRLRENRALVSDALVLLLEVILLDQKQSAQALARRYARTGLPPPIRHLVNFKTAKLISDSSAQNTQSTQSSHGSAGVVIRLHPLWFNDSQCRVAVSGRMVTAAETPTVSPGESFYAQRICDNPSSNRLAQGVAPNGKETLYIGFREAPADTNNETIDNEQRAAQSKTSLGLSSMSPSPIQVSALRSSGIGILSGIGRARLGSAGQRPTNAASPGAPFVIHALRIFVGDEWAVLLQASNIALPENNNTIIISENSERETADTDQTAKTGLEKRFLSRISLEYGKNFGPAVAQLRPTLGVGITSLSRGTHSFNNPQYLAPHCGIGLELGSSPFSGDFTFSLRPMVSLAPPPFSGVLAELLLGVTIVL